MPPGPIQAGYARYVELAAEGVVPKHPGDPSPRSPRDVLKDRSYRTIKSEQLANDMVCLIVFHRGTETYWRVYYKSFDDGKQTSWEQVVPRAKTIVDYELVS